MSHHRFLLPRRDHSWLINPVSDQWPPLLAANQGQLAQAVFDCQGRTLQELRRLTQEHVRQAGVRYTSELLGRDVSAPTAENWIVTGHQPELFHVGVWVKNFAVQRLAQTTQSIGLNLIIDNDTHTGTGIAVPTGTRTAPQREVVLFDDPRPVSPWEELPVANRELFDSFAARVQTAVSPWGFTPLISDAWSEAKRYAARTSQPRLADCLAAARANTEWAWNAGNLELPLSQLEQLPGFYWFTSQLLAHLPRFQSLHNEVVRDYRRRNRLRSRTHPVPDLATQDEWIEAPFWVWRAGDMQRDRLFARQVAQEIWLRDRREVFLKLPLTPERSACCAVEQLATLPSRGIKLRSRALTTTLFARMFLADLFVHGIGGAKYDEMTDDLIARFYGLQVPAYATVSATLHLPLGGTWDVTAQSLGETAHTLWELDHQPERFVPHPEGMVQALIAEKQQLIHTQQHSESRSVRSRSFTEREANRRRYQRLREINRQLQAAVQESRGATQSQRAQLLSQQTANRTLGSREFSWVLLPEDLLRNFVAESHEIQFANG